MHRLPSKFFDITETNRISDRQFLTKSLLAYLEIQCDYYSFKSTFKYTRTSDDTRTQFQIWAIESGMHYIEVALDYSQSLDQQLDDNAQATHPAACALLRQAMECALVAKWIMQPNTSAGLAETGFAITYRNLKKQRKYATAAFEARMPWMSVRLSDASAIDRMMKILTAMGQEMGFIDTRHYVHRYIPSYNQLFQQCHIRDENINLRWIYELLSSVIHGDVLGFNPSEYEFAQIVKLKDEILKEAIIAYKLNSKL